MPSIRERLSRGWNAFRNKDPVEDLAPVSVEERPPAVISWTDPSRSRLRRVFDKTVVPSIYTRLSVDAAQARLEHIRTDSNGGYLEPIDSGLNQVLTVQANCDQTGRAFVQDLVMSMLGEGVVAAVPIDTTASPRFTQSYDILSMRTGKITGWYPREVDVEVYNDRRGKRETIRLPKDCVAIIENPFYSVMNEPNSTLQRLSKKLSLLDSVDETIASGKLDMIIQLPYAIKSETRKEQAEKRKADLEKQLENSKYGVAYIDSTEKITQLNRSLENNLLSQIEYLTRMLYSQLGLNEDIMNGTANESSMLNYYKRTVNPLLDAIVDEFECKFLSKTARTQRQAIKYYRDPFVFTPANEMADLADKFTRNEILAPNEVRTMVGFKPSTDPNADELRNRNISQSAQREMAPPVPVDEEAAARQDQMDPAELGYNVVSGILE